MANGIYLSEVRREVRKTVREVSYQELTDAFRRSELNQMYFECVDTRYRVLPEKTWELFLRWSGVDDLKYESEFHDCDDFAYILKGECHRKLKINGIGLIIDCSGGHAYSALAVDRDDGRLHIASVEPQNDRLVLKNEGMYLAQFGAVRF